MISHKFLPLLKSQDLKPPNLKSLYGLLVHLSLDKLVPNSDDEDHWNRFDPRFDLGRLVMRSEDRHSVGELLFRELDFRFGILFSALSDASGDREKARAIQRLDVPARVEELTLLLRCCMVLLRRCGARENPSSSGHTWESDCFRYEGE